MNINFKAAIFVLSLFSLTNCSDSGKKKFHPNKDNSEQYQLSDTKRDSLIREKKEKYAQNQTSIYDQQIVQFDGKVKLTVMIPNDQGLSSSENSALESKIIQMVAANGIGGIGGNPRFIVAPIVNILKRDVSSTAPIRYSIHYEVLFYVADILSGNVYGTYEMKFIGVESSEPRAFLTGFNQLNPNDAGFQKFLSSSQEKILKYYIENGDKIIAEANTLANQKKYSQAISLLESIPMEAEITYSKGLKEITSIFQKYLDNECQTVLAMMKSALGNYNDQSGAGYNTDAMAYYKMIPVGGACQKEADGIYNSYKKGLNPQKIKDWEKAEKEWQFKVSQQNSDNEFRKLQEELKSKIAIEGSGCLLEKYKKDAAYDRLPWLRKLIYLGDHDPFDGYTPVENCK
jgi:hypothetical protein